MSVAEKVRDYVNNRPYVSEALEKAIVNISELSRVIEKELGLQDTYAVKAALRRHSQRLRENRRRREEAVLDLLKKSRLMVLDNLSIVITDSEVDITNKLKIKLTDLHHVYLVDKSSLRKIREDLGDIMCKIHENCTALIVNSHEEMETTPGVVSYLTSLLAGQNVYSLAFASCYTETTIIVKRQHALKSYEILSKVVG